MLLTFAGVRGDKGVLQKDGVPVEQVGGGFEVDFGVGVSQSKGEGGHAVLQGRSP